MLHPSGCHALETMSPFPLKFLRQSVALLRLPSAFLCALGLLFFGLFFLFASMSGKPREGCGSFACLLAEGLPLLVVRPNGRIAMASRSARRLLGLAGGGGNILSLAGGQALEALRRALRHPFERTESFSAAFPGTGGVERLYRMESSPVGDGDTSTGIVLRDITNVPPHAPAALEAAGMAVTASSMAGPLSVLSGWLETAQETEAVMSPVVVRAMVRQVELLKGIAAELCVKPEAASARLLTRSFDLVMVVQGAADALASRMLETGSCLELSYSEAPFMLSGDALLWQQMAGELLGSALRQPGARRLRLAAERRPQSVVVRIESDGPSYWDSAPAVASGRNRFELLCAAIRALHGEFEYELDGPMGSRYHLTFPV